MYIFFKEDRFNYGLNIDPWTDTPAVLITSSIFRSLVNANGGLKLGLEDVGIYFYHHIWARLEIQPISRFGPYEMEKVKVQVK